MKMNLMRKAMLVMISTLLSTIVWAQDVGVVAGLRSDNADGEGLVKITGKSNFNAGVIAKFDVSAPLQIRSGFLYTQRAYDYALTGSPTSAGEFKMTYFEIPVGLLWKFSDYGGVFAGPALSLNLSKSCPGGSCNNAEVNSSPLAIQLGGSFKVAPQFGFEVYYETMTSALAKDIKNGRSVVANVMITFD